MNDQDISKKSSFVAHGQSLSAKDPNFSAFFTHSIAATSDEDLAGISPQNFETLLRHSFTRFGVREANNHDVNIWSPDDGTPNSRQIVDVFTDDMPFLVDSVLGAIRACGTNVHLISHPILPVDTTVPEWKIKEAASENCHSESFLQIHIDPITDEVALAALYEELNGVLTEVRSAVAGWRPMLERLHALVQDYRGAKLAIPTAVLAESLHFLAWLADHNFTFLGMREYKLTGSGDDARLDPVSGSGLGILDNPNFHFLRHGTEYVEMTQEHLAFLKRDEPLMVTKANVRGRVHRRAHMDYIGVKLYEADGSLSGELRMIGLFTSMSLSTPHTDVPLIRRKITEVMRRSGYDPKSHAGKALMASLDSYPRDELFQCTEDQLFEFAMITATLPDRPRVRVLPRIDQFDNFVSLLVYVPRDRYTSDIRAQIGDLLAERYDGRVSAYYPHFPESESVRVHFIIGRNGGKTPQPDRVKLEAEIEEFTHTFGDRLLEDMQEPATISDYRDAFPVSYQSYNSPKDARTDIAILKSLSDGAQIAVNLRPSETDDTALGLKIYHTGAPIPLSDRVPMLENFGFRVIDERTDVIMPTSGEKHFIHDMVIRPPQDLELDLDVSAPLLEQALLKIWAQEAENDSYNQLTLRANLSWDHAALLRAFGRYMRQMGVGFSQEYLAQTLCTYPDVANGLVKLFHVHLDPQYEGDKKAEATKLTAAIEERLTTISSLDEDRIIRHLLNLMQSCLRTNFFQRGENSERRPALALKFSPRDIEGLSEPRPYREIFVYAPRVEGVHLRFGAIARGGLRWSDRPEDFRTEVLGLVKAQQVKNAIIVPVGSKGGFVPKLMPANPGRDTFMAEGIACYKIFIGTLLDITDNLHGDDIVEPKNVLRPDGDDPYLVVAADKGTASFSDIANGISQERNFWLDDAFASGGSVGYDHKKMGITARGGWESVKRHFREMEHDIQSKPFTAVGVGDMSGDVFGNGMLLSQQTQLIAAFDHRDIFIDPTPDVEVSYKERKRLFELGRSSWKDYDENALSPGGGIYARSLKSITLSLEAQRALNLETDTISPQDLMRAILLHNADLLWFGGIGTYIRSEQESDADAGDRANDALRITGNQVRAKVVGEGANLGLTQRGRIEYALNGGRVNTDAIDNSAGVNSSDLEVNIKIALGTLVRDKVITTPERNDFLATMTDEVAQLCLRNNYLQTLALSLTEMDGMAEFPDLVRFMQQLEKDGHLDRAVEFLPDDLALQERAASNIPFTRPETAVLLAYAKNTLYEDLLNSNVPDDPYLATELYRYFPEKLKANYPQTIENHRLRREVIATVLANAMINRGGPTFVHNMSAATSANAYQIAFAYAAVRDSYGLVEFNVSIDALDNKVNGKTQLALYDEVKTLQVNQTLWFLRNVNFANGLSEVVKRYGEGIKEVRELLAKTVSPYVAKSIADQAIGFIDGGAPRDLARRVAELSALTLATDIVFVAERTKASIAETTEAYFKVLTAFHLGRITEQGGHLSLSDPYDRMALDRALANVMQAQRDLTSDILTSCEGDIETRYANWHNARAQEIDGIIEMVTNLTEGDLTVSRLSVAAGLLSDLVRR